MYHNPIVHADSVCKLLRQNFFTQSVFGVSIGNVIKQLVHYQVMVHLGSLKSYQEARAALGYRLKQVLRFFRALQSSCMHKNSTVHAKS